MTLKASANPAKAHFTVWSERHSHILPSTEGVLINANVDYPLRLETIHFGPDITVKSVL